MKNIAYFHILKWTQYCYQGLASFWWFFLFFFLCHDHSSISFPLGTTTGNLLTSDDFFFSFSQYFIALNLHLRIWCATFHSGLQAVVNVERPLPIRRCVTACWVLNSDMGPVRVALVMGYSEATTGNQQWQWALVSLETIATKTLSISFPLHMGLTVCWHCVLLMGLLMASISDV